MRRDNFELNGIRGANSDKDLIDLVREFIRITSFAKGDRNARAHIHERYYVGDSYLKFDRLGGNILIDNNVLRGIVVNLMAGNIDHVASVLTESHMYPEGRATTSDPQDIRSANYMTAILRDHARRNGSAARLKHIAHRAMLTGDEFVRVWYDPEQLGSLELSGEEMQAWTKMTGQEPLEQSQVGEDKFRAVFRVGGTREARVPGNLVFVDTGSEDWDSVTRFCVVDYMPVHKVRLMFPQNADKIRPEYIQNTSDAGEMPRWAGAFPQHNQQGYSSHSVENGLVTVYEYWEMSTGGGWDRAVVIGRENGIVVEKNLGLKDNNYAHYPALRASGFWSKSFAEDQRQLQFSLNSMTTRKIRFFAETVKNTILMPKGSKIKGLTNDFNQIVEYDAFSGAKPEYRPMDASVLQVFESMIADIEAKMERVSQVSSVARGSTNTRFTGVAVQELREANSTPIFRVRENIKEAEARKWRLVALLAQQNYTMPRLLKIGGDQSDLEVREFSRSDILAGTDVDVVDSDVGEVAKNRRLDLSLQIMSSGVFAPGMEDQLDRMMQFVETGRVESIRDELEVLGETQAAAEYKAIMDGHIDFGPLPMMRSEQPGGVETQVPPLVYIGRSPFEHMVPGNPIFHESQPHNAHIKQHILDANRSQTPPQVRNLILAHIQSTHAMALQQQQQQEQQAQLALMGEQALQEAKGNLATTLASAVMAQNENDAKEKAPSTPAQGGRNSGKTRQKT